MHAKWRPPPGSTRHAKRGRRLSAAARAGHHRPNRRMRCMSVAIHQLRASGRANTVPGGGPDASHAHVHRHISKSLKSTLSCLVSCTLHARKTGHRRSCRPVRPPPSYKRPPRARAAATHRHAALPTPVATLLLWWYKHDATRATNMVASRRAARPGETRTQP